MIKAAKENPGTNEHPWSLLMKKYFKDNIPKMYMFAACYTLTLFIQDPDMCQDLFLNKNKFLDKNKNA